MTIQSWEDNGYELKLFLPKEFDFEENINYLSRNRNECLFHIHDNRIYKAIQIGEETPIIEVRSADENHLIVRFLGEQIPTSRKIRSDVALHVREWFDLDRDLSPFYSMAKDDPLLGEAVESFYGLRIIGIPDIFEALCWGILGQQINLSFAYTLKRRMVEKFGRSVLHNGATYWVFPSPAEIAELPVEELENLRMTKKKSEYIIGVAQQIVDGKLSKEMLQQMGDYKSAENILVKIRGIGPWTANYVLMRCLRYPSAFPIDDVGLQNSIKHRLDKEKKPTKEEILKLAVNWANWESYATFYLWRFLY
ncbi:DNA-3-methyladenine glycosylase [Neobacillus sp. DY30]|uniref:DNA-3-methyladenine glycosylase family protein n=1 Tax=Neobacillus sp. DY30 TaxID=3047871 RepID=UPI0024C07867|nr:DNA-3-methyladenine glycosylase [Neobacillus sp. DY30]WHX98244.1 DNA-3-methyladenine glycosylase [Neobacillus sp. DY30]